MSAECKVDEFPEALAAPRMSITFRTKHTHQQNREIQCIHWSVPGFQTGWIHWWLPEQLSRDPPSCKDKNISTLHNAAPWMTHCRHGGSTSAMQRRHSQLEGSHHCVPAQIVNQINDGDKRSATEFKTTSLSFCFSLRSTLLEKN